VTAVTTPVAAAHPGRSRGIGSRPHADGPSPDRVALVAALAKIPAQQRKAVVLHHLGHLSVAEIAAQEDVAEGTVKSWLSRGRAALAEHLQH
jgi:RNA polymerase sigma-70 factor (ECF subfamily)